MSTQEQDLLGRVQVGGGEEPLGPDEEEQEDDGLLGRVQVQETEETPEREPVPLPQGPERTTEEVEARNLRLRDELMRGIEEVQTPSEDVERTVRRAPPEAARSATAVFPRERLENQLERRRRAAERLEEEARSTPLGQSQSLRSGLEDVRPAARETTRMETGGEAFARELQPPTIREPTEEEVEQTRHARRARDIREQGGGGVGQVGPAFEQGVGFSMEAVGGTLKRVGEAIGNEDLIEEGDLLERGGSIRGQEGAEGRTTMMTSQINTPEDFVDFAIGSTFQGLGTTVGPLVGGALGGAVAGPAGAAVGALGPSYALGRQEAKRALIEAGIEEDRANDLADWVGIPMAALEALVPAAAGRAFTGGLRRQVVRSTAGRLARVLGAGGTESATESLQELTTSIASAAETGNPLEWGEVARAMGESGAAAFFPGMAFGAAGEVTTAGGQTEAERRRARLEERGRRRREGETLVDEEAAAEEEVAEAEAPGPEAETPGFFDKVRRRVATAVDPTVAEELDEARREAGTDDLTGLPNRRGEREAREELERRRPRNGTTVELEVDLDNFGEINKRLGHQAGDEALQVAAGALREATREGDAVVARKGGDEFRVSLNVRQEDNPQDIARRIEQQVQTALEEAGYAEVEGTPVGASVGLGEEGLQARKRERGVSESEAYQAEDLTDLSDTDLFDVSQEAVDRGDSEKAQAVMEEIQRRTADPEAREAPALEGEGVNAPTDPDAEGIPGWMPEGARFVRATQTRYGVSERVWEMPKEIVGIDPERFQFKEEGIGERGVTRKFQQEGMGFNDDYAGVLLAWRDPSDGKVWVVNGHHRLDLARRDPGASHVLVRFIDAETAADARKIGAMTNIAEGQGTPLDAAKFFREEGITRENLQDFDIPITEHVADLGLALRDLHQTIFQEVATGKFPARRAAIIGRAGLSDADQIALWKSLQKQERGDKRRLTNAELEELIRQVKSAPTVTEEEISLFGEEQVERNLFEERAVLSNYVKNQISQDRKLAGYLTRAGRAARIEETEMGQIETERAEEIGEEAAAFEAYYQAMSTRQGPVADVLSEEAANLADNPDNENAIKQRAHERIREILEEEIAASQRGGEVGEGRIDPTAPEDLTQGFAGENQPARGERDRVDPPSPDNIESRYRVGGVVFDASEGMGSVPFNENVMHKGFVLFLRPSEFLKLAGGRPPGKISEQHAGYIREAVEAGESVGPPFLDMFHPGAVENLDFAGEQTVEYERWTVKGHEGRHRMMALQEIAGDVPIPVHVFMRGGYRAEDIRPSMLRSLRDQITAQVTGEGFTFDRPVEVFYQGDRYQIGEEGQTTRERGSMPDGLLSPLIQGGPGSAFAGDPRQESIFGETRESRERVEQAELGIQGPGTEGITEAQRKAKKTVRLLSKKIEEGAATETELRRYRQAIKVLRHAKAQTQEEVSLDAKIQQLEERGEREGPLEGQRGMFGPEFGSPDDHIQDIADPGERWQASVTGVPGTLREVIRWVEDGVASLPFTSPSSQPYVPEYTGLGQDPDGPIHDIDRPGLPDDYAREEVMEEIEDAKGLPDDEWWRTPVEAMKAFVRGFERRRAQHLPTRAGLTERQEGVDVREKFGFAREKLAQLEKQASNGIHEAVERLADITSGMNKRDYDLFSIRLLLADLQHSEEGHLLPFGFESTDEIKDALAKVDAAVSENEVVQDAMDRRNAHIAQVRERLITALEDLGDTQIREILSRPDYFHHQVLEHARNEGIIDRLDRVEQPSPRTEGYMRRRVGTEKPHNTDYLQAEGEVLARMAGRAREAEILKEVGDHYDISDQVRARLKAFQEEDQIDLGMDFSFDVPARARSKIEQGEELLLNDLIPDGHTTWQPRPGSRFYYAASIPQDIAEGLMEDILEVAEITKDDVRTVLARGQRHPEWIIPDELAAQLNDMPQNSALATDVGKFANSVQQSQNLWKQWQLISPRRYARYNLRNLTGDAEATFVGNWKAFRKVPRAVKELRALFDNGSFTKPLFEWYQRGGMGQLLQVQEMGEVNELDQFIRFSEHNRPEGVTQKALEPIKRAWNYYWTKARETTDYREAILRYANYLEYIDQMESNPDGTPDDWAASFREEVMALPDVKDRAFKMQNELVGAYDQISPNGENLRRYIYPFWSFSEINFRRFKIIIQNAARDDQMMGALSRKAFGTMAIRMPYVAMRLTSFMVKANALFAMTQAWNLMHFPEEEEALPDDIRGRPHLVLGRGEGGEIRYFSRMGAISELQEWFGMDDWWIDGRDWLNGQKTITEIATESFYAPVNRFAGGTGPFIKYPAEFLTGVQLWPQILPFSEARSIRDRWEHFFQGLGMGPEYRAIMGKPQRQPWLSWDTLQELPYYTTEPNAGGYWDTQDQKYEFLKSIGEARTGGFMSKRSQTLYELRRAMTYGDQNAVIKYAREYAELNGIKVGEDEMLHVTDPEGVDKFLRGFQQSVENLHPLSGLSEHQKVAFQLHLTGMKPMEAMQQANEILETGEISGELQRQILDRKNTAPVRDYMRALRHYDEIKTGERIRERQERER